MTDHEQKQVAFIREKLTAHLERQKAAEEHAKQNYAMGMCDWCNGPAGATVTDTATGNVFKTCQKHMAHTYEFADCAFRRGVHGLGVNA